MRGYEMYGEKVLKKNNYIRRIRLLSLIISISIFVFLYNSVRIFGDNKNDLKIIMFSLGSFFASLFMLLGLFLPYDENEFFKTFTSFNSSKKEIN